MIGNQTDPRSHWIPDAIPPIAASARTRDRSPLPDRIPGQRRHDNGPAPLSHTSHVPAAMRRLLEVLANTLWKRPPMAPSMPPRDEASAMVARLEATLAGLTHEMQILKDNEHMLNYHMAHLEQVLIERDQALECERLKRQRAEEQLARLERWERLAPILGSGFHALNNTLSGVVTYPGLLLLKLADNNPLIKPLRSIKQSGEKAVEISRDLQILWRPRRGSGRPINLQAVVDQYRNSTEFRQIHERFPAIAILDEGSDDPAPFPGDSEYLATILHHLVTNAVHAMPNGGTIRIATGRRIVPALLQASEPIPEGAYATLEVVDQGHGLAQEDLKRLLTPLPRSTNGLHGLGLGLAVVRELVKQLDGFIDYASDGEQWSKVTLFFPLTPTSDAG